ncbi:hypothetical protein D3C76_1339410 [compost metagenome]
MDLILKLWIAAGEPNRLYSGIFRLFIHIEIARISCVGNSGNDLPVFQLGKLINLPFVRPYIVGTAAVSCEFGDADTAMYGC